MGMVISTHLPPPVMIDSTDVLKCVTHMLCWTWAMYFSAAASSENDHGSMNLDSKTAPVPSTVPSRVATIQGIAECLTRRWTSVTCRPARPDPPLAGETGRGRAGGPVRQPHRAAWGRHGSAQPDLVRFHRSP